MKRRVAALASIAILLGGLGIAGCERGRVEVEQVPPDGPIMETKVPDVPVSDSALRALPAPGVLGTVVAVPVRGFTGPGGHPFEVAARTHEAVATHARRFGMKTLVTALRAEVGNVGQYPCTSCHLGRRMVLTDTRMPDVHQSIVPVHPAATGSTCSTCHAAVNVEELGLRSGERASLDHAYLLCAQCHFRQAEAWAAGAHGKRLDGWAGRRVVMGCADCHDPHNPALLSRIPFRAPVLRRPGGPEK
jgi:hypothetical protein